MKSFNPYKILHIEKNATNEQIGAAYKKLAKKYHPDVNNGDSEMFLTIKRARDTLMDAEARAFYDSHGMGKDAREALLKRAHQEINNMVINIVDNLPLSNVKHMHIIAEMRKALNAAINNNKTAKKEAEAKLKKAREYHKEIEARLIRRAGAHDLFAAAFANIERHSQHQIDNHAEIIQTCEIALELLKDYDFKPDEQIRQRASFIYTPTATTNF